VLKGGVGVFVGPGQTEDQIQPIEAERISTTLTSGAALLFRSIGSHQGGVHQQPEQPVVPAPRVRERVHAAGEGLSVHGVRAAGTGGNLSANVAYVGSQGRNLFLRSIANRTVGVQSNGAAAGTQVREFDIVTGTRTARLPASSVPFAEFDYKTSGGHDGYNAMQAARFHAPVDAAASR
jgi:hypothetical protein